MKLLIITTLLSGDGRHTNMVDYTVLGIWKKALQSVEMSFQPVLP